MVGTRKHIIIVALLWIFAPLAWYFMWKDEKYHSWFPSLLWMNGIIFAVVFAIQSFLNFPHTNALLAKYNIHTFPNFNLALAIVLILFAFAQIIFGYYLKKHIAKNKFIADPYIGLILAIFSIDFLMGFLTGLVNLLLPIGKIKSIL